MAAVREQDAPVSLPSRNKTRPASRSRHLVDRWSPRRHSGRRPYSDGRSLSVKITPVIATGGLRFTSACRARPEHRRRRFAVNRPRSKLLRS